MELDQALQAQLEANTEAMDRSREALEEKRVVGLVLLVSQDGRLVYSRAAGYADREAGQVMREDHVFRLASITKPIVSAAALPARSAFVRRLTAIGAPPGTCLPK
jgi:CubicO group peptidase (beta-lactamase class C family)